MARRIDKNSIDIITVVMSLIVGVFIGLIISKKIKPNENNINVMEEINNLDYFYILQIAKFDNPTGAINYQKVLNDKNLYSVIVLDNNYYYIYGGISDKEEGLSTYASRYNIMGYDTIVKKELIDEKVNSILDDNVLLEFYLECIHNLFLSLQNKPFVISDKYSLNPINIELYTDLTILTTLKNDDLRYKTQLQAYKLITEAL